MIWPFKKKETLKPIEPSEGFIYAPQSGKVTVVVYYPKGWALPPFSWQKAVSDTVQPSQAL